MILKLKRITYPGALATLISHFEEDGNISNGSCSDKCAVL